MVVRTVEVAASRLPRWITNFADRHGPYRLSGEVDALTLTAQDGATAVVEPPFPPLRPSPPSPPDGDALASLIAQAQQPRVIGVLLVRLGGYAAGVFEGDTLVASKVGSRQVHGRSAAGGWSQHRFARRREGQARVALAAAADAAAGVLLPALPRLDAVVTGGDRGALRTVLDDVRLRGLAPLVVGRILDVPDPKAKVLQESIHTATAVRITISEPD